MSVALGAKEVAVVLLSSEVRGDLLALFHRNPGLIDTVEGVALRIGRRGEAIEGDVKALVDLGVLKTKMSGDKRVIVLDRARDREIQSLLADHVRTVAGTGSG